MAADTNSPLLKLLLQGTGNNDNSWGENLNNFVFTYLEQAVAGVQSIAVDGGTDVLTAAQNRASMLVFTGTLTANQTIEIDNVSHSWLVRNATTGNFSLTIKTAAGTGKTVPQGGFRRMWCDGADNVYMGFATDAAGTTVYGDINFTGALTIGGERPFPIGGSMPYDGILAPKGFLFRAGQQVSRTTYALLFNVLTITANATKNGTTSLTAVDVDFTALGLLGAPIEGAGINIGTTVTAVTSTTITLSQAASGGGAVAIRILPHGQGDGLTTFNIPDRRGRVDVGRDGMNGTAANRVTGSYAGSVIGGRLGAVGGEEGHFISIAEMPAHNHTGSATSFASSTASVSDPSHTHVAYAGNPVLSGGGIGGAGLAGTINAFQAQVNYAYTGISVGVSTSVSTSISINNNGSGGAHNTMQPSGISNSIIFTGVYL